MMLWSTSVIYGIIIATSIPVIAFLILVVKYHLYKKKEVESTKTRYNWVTDPERKQKYIDEYLDGINKFTEWILRGHLGKLYFIIVVFLIFFTTTIMICGNVYDVRSQEGVKYHTMLVEREDIIDSGFKRFSAGSFNKRLVEQQQYSINPNYKYNFTGDYDWFAIEPIKIK